MLGVIWWMYGGYAWLTNAVRAGPPSRRAAAARRHGARTSCWRSRSRARSRAAGRRSGSAYLAVVVVHAGCSRARSSERSRGPSCASRRSTSAAALLVLAGGIAGGTAQYVLWAAALLLEWITPFLAGGASGFEIAARALRRAPRTGRADRDRRVGRRGRGRRGARPPIDAELVRSPCSVSRSAPCLWWAYFGGDDAARRAGPASPPPPQRRPAMALVGVLLLAPADPARHRASRRPRSTRRPATRRASCPPLERCCSPQASRCSSPAMRCSGAPWGSAQPGGGCSPHCCRSRRSRLAAPDPQRRNSLHWSRYSSPACCWSTTPPVAARRPSSPRSVHVATSRPRPAQTADARSAGVGARSAPCNDPRRTRRPARCPAVGSWPRFDQTASGRPDSSTTRTMTGRTVKLTVTSVTLPPQPSPSALRIDSDRGAHPRCLPPGAQARRSARSSPQ